MSDLSSPFDICGRAAEDLVDRLPTAPSVAVVLGSGWSAAADALGEVVTEIPVTELPGFAPSTVPGHRGMIRLTDAGGRPVLVFMGRTHLYEGHGVDAVVHGVRTAILAGCTKVLLTNAAGSTNLDFGVGTPVVVTDHLNLTGAAPLTGSLPPEPWNNRFTDLTAAYSPRLRALARAVDPGAGEGVYAGFHGPNYETPAEVQMAKQLGADLVGMSTVLEVIAARHLGAEVLAVSLVTNLAAGIAPEPLSHEEVVAAGHAAGPRVAKLLRGVVDRLHETEV